jgi:branched-chain amino acid transport system ATP-binding protein
VSEDGILRTEGLTCDFGALRAVDAVSLSVAPGAIHSVIGPNAAGKSTFFSMIAGEILPTAGRVYFEGRDITALPSHRVPHVGIARCFQRSSLFPKLSVLENVWLAAFARSRPRAFDFLRRVGDLRESCDRARRIVAQVGLEAKLLARAETLSHGQQRMLEVAIGLAGAPTLLLMDEPTQGLAPEASRNMTELIKRLAGQYTILLIEHKMDIVMSISQRITVMHFGQVIAEGTPDEIRRNNAVRKAYLGGRA